MVINKGELWWADLGIPHGSEPGYKRPVLIIQSNNFNKSKIKTVICVVITSNEILAEAPGNVLLSKDDTNLTKDSVANVSQIITIDKDCLIECIGSLNSRIYKKIEAGIKLILEISAT